MHYQSTHLIKKLSALSLGVILLLSSSLGLALDKSSTQSAHNKSTDAQAMQVEKRQVVNLNKSTFEQLVTLKGIGHTKAQAIIVYRNDVGGFKSVDELINVSGIGEKVVNENKARLTI